MVFCIDSNYYNENSSIKNANNTLKETENASIFYDENTTDNIKLIAHRGYNDIAPENTIPAYIAANDYGFTTAECDITWTKDNVPVLLHDKTINRTASKQNGIFPMILPRFCKNYTYEELLNYDFGKKKSKEFEGTNIPTFDEILECSSDTGLNLYVELKETDNFDEEKANILANKVKEAGLEDKVTWISFEADYLKLMKNIMPESRLGYISKQKVTEDTIETLKSLKTEKNEVFLDIKSTMIDENADKLLDDAGFNFEAWTIDDIYELKEIASYGCSGYTTNILTPAFVNEVIKSETE